MIQISQNSEQHQLIKNHDYFNIIVLPFLFISNCISLSILTGTPDIFIKNYFDFFYYFFLSYISIDLSWLLIQPECVGQPVPIIFHHVICLIGWILSTNNSDFSLLARICSLVELNTFFNILKRYYKYDVIYYLFYITWFGFRLGMLPYLCYLSSLNLLNCLEGSNITTCYDCLFFTSSAYLIQCLNLKWTWDLMTKKGYLGVSSKKD